MPDQSGGPISPKLPRRRRLELPLVAALLAITALATYWPVLESEYLFADDYPQFCDRQEFAVHAPYGRPVLGAMFLLLPEKPHDLAPFTRLRAFSLCGAVLFGVLLWGVVLRRILPVFAAGLAALACVLLPPFHFYAAASTAYPIVWTACLALGAGGLASRAFLPSRPLRIDATACLAGIALLLEIAALSAYQPAAMCFWLALIPALVDARFVDCPVWRKRTFAVALLGLSSMLIYFAAFKIAGFSGLINAPARVGLTMDPIGKLLWFVQKPLVRAASLWGVYEWRYVIAAGAIAVIAAAAIRAWRDIPAGQSRGAFFKATGLAALPVLAYAPVLAVAEDWPSYRSLLPLTIVVGTFVALAAWRLSEHLRPGAKLVVGAAAVAIVAAAGFSARHNVADNIVAVQRAELDYLLAHLKTLDPNDLRAIHVVMSHYSRGPEFPAKSDEFGIRSASRPRWTVDMVRCGLRLLGKPEPSAITCSPALESAPTAAEVLVVDMNAIRWTR